VSYWVALRAIKFAFVAALAAGTTGAAVGPTREWRLRFAQGLCTVGFVGTWLPGYEMLRLTGRGFDLWTMAGAASSLVSFHLAISGTHRRTWSAPMATTCLALLFATIALMVLRPMHPTGFIVPLAFGAVAGSSIVAWASRGVLERDGGERAEFERRDISMWVRWVGRVEALTLLTMLLVSVPLKVLFSFSLDGGTGLLGWTHGTAVLVYFQAVTSGGRALRWRWREIGLGLLVAMFPFGTLWFERRQSKADAYGRGG